MSEKHEKTIHWLSYAFDDHESLVLEKSPRAQIYLGDQVIEKIMKAFLIHHDVAFRPIYNFGYLATLIGTVDSSLLPFGSRVSLLPEYSKLSRYPDEGGTVGPAATDVDDVLAAVSETLTLFQTRFPEEIWSAALDQASQIRDAGAAVSPRAPPVSILKKKVLDSGGGGSVKVDTPRPKP